MPPRDSLILTSTDNPRVKQVVRLRTQRERRRSGLFIAEGMREVGRAAMAGLVIRELYICPEVLADSSLADVSATERIEVNDRVMQKLAYREHPEGVLAVVEQPQWSLEDVLGGNRAESGSIAAPLVLVAVGLAKPGNLGAMARTADAAGCAGIIAADSVVDAFNPNAIRASTACVFSLPIVLLSTEETLQALHNAGFRVMATDPAAGDDPWKVDMRGPTAIVIGAEDRGLDPRWMTAAHARVRIPMRGQTADSLNASVSAGMLLYEAMRQRDT